MANHIRETDAGVIVGDTTSAQVGFYGARGAAQRRGLAQGAVAGAATSVASTVGAAVSTAAATDNVGIFGFEQQSQADSIVALLNQCRDDNLALQAGHAALLTDSVASIAFANELRLAMMGVNLIKGSA